MSDDRKFSEKEELLARILDECLEEDLSFVPPGREIERHHKFSERFEEAMARILAGQEEKAKEAEVRKHFSPRYGQWAACILVFLVCGGLLAYLGSSMGSKEFSGAGEQTADSSAAEESAAAGLDEGAEEVMEEAAEADPDPDPNGRTYCGHTVYPAEQQLVPESLPEVTTLVNCPVQDEENDEIYLTIGNIGEETVRYLNRFELEVWLADGWYVLEPETEAPTEWLTLEAGMAVDEVIDLSAYVMDHDAERYRVIACVNDERISAEFTFEEVFTETMKQLEEEASGE